MKHKYIIVKDGDAAALSIKEYAELDKGVFSFVCEEKYDFNRFQDALAKGKKNVLALLRTKNFFPPSQFAERILASITACFGSPDDDPMELLCDDADFLTHSPKTAKEIETFEEEVEPLDDFIEDDDSLETDFDDPVNTRDGVTSIKVDMENDDDSDLDENS